MAKKAGKPGIRPQFKEDFSAVTMQLYDVEAEKVLAAKTFQMEDIHGSLKARLPVYGLSCWLQQRVSQEGGAAKRLAAMVDYFQLLKEGRWEKEREGGGGPTVSAEVEAIARLKTINVSQAQVALRNVDADTKAKILANPKVKEMADKIRKERESANSAVDLKDLL